MSSRGTAIRYDDSELRQGIDALRKAGLSPRPLMRQIGAYYAGETTKNFRDARRLYPPKPAHWAEWQGSKTPLHGVRGGERSMRLAGSITHEEPTDSSTRVGSPLHYAAAHNFGANTGKRFVIWIMPKLTPKGRISRFKNGLPHGKLVVEGTPGAIKVYMRQRIKKRQFLKEPTEAQSQEIRQRAAQYFERKLQGRT